MIYSTEEIEQAFIGSLLADSNNVVLSYDILTEDDLTTQAARIAYSVIKQAFMAKKPVNLQSLLLEPELKGHLAWLSAADDCGISKNCLRFAEQIAESSRINRLAEKVKRLQNFAGQDSEGVLADIKAVYTSEISGGKDSSDMAFCLNTFDQQVEKNLAAGCLGWESGFDVFANLDIQYEPSHCWAYGGESSVGKTSLLIEQVLRVLSIYGAKSPKMAIHSTEMKNYQLVARLLSGMTGIGAKLILRGKTHPLIDSAREVLFNSGLKIYDVNRDFDVFYNQCRKDKMQGGVDLVWVDYLQNFKRKGEKGYELMAGMGKDCLALPQELDLTLFVLAQMAKDDIQKDNGGLFFKGGGELSESCDLGFKLAKSKKFENNIFVEHGKNRHGGKRDFFLEFVPHSNRLDEVSR